MNAVVPLNIAAVRVSANDNSNIVGSFKGRVANFNQIPYLSSDQRASTGDTVVWPLNTGSAPLNPLGTGIHVHWELPDYFRRGVQQPGSEAITFPQVPNRWLVVRRLSTFNSATGTWTVQPPQSWIVESDYITTALIPDSDGKLRPAAPVPLPVPPPRGQQPYRYMGRVISASSWNPSSESPSDFLPSYKGPDGKPYYLTANGFLGPGFSSYYPDSCSVFGFWDRFLDQPTIAAAIAANQPIQFKVSYQVVGWVDPSGTDPLDLIAQQVTSQYNTYVDQCVAQNVEVAETPATVFGGIAEKSLRWNFNLKGITFTLDSNQKIETLNLPSKTLCAGVLQDVVWNMLTSPGTSYFLNNPTPGQQPGVWTDTVELAIGNTPVEALSALLKKDLNNTNNDPDVLKNYEYLLDALQLGLLRDLEGKSNKIIELEEGLHSGGFAREQGGQVWIVQPKQADPTKPHNADREITLPLDLAEQLSLLNAAQKCYDTGRASLDLMRQQLFMDWYRYVKMAAGGVVDPNVTKATLINFLTLSGGSELTSVVAAGTATGILQYTFDSTTGAINGMQAPTGTTSLAYQVWTNFNAFKTALVPHKDWEVFAVSAPPFWLPTDPVVLMEGNRIEPVRRNGTAATIRVRLSTEVLDTLTFGYQGSNFSVAASTLTNPPSVPAAAPYFADTAALVGEGGLLMPQVADGVADALKAQGGTNNPTVNYSNFVTALNAAQGGLSPLSGGPGGGLFQTVRAETYQPAANPVQTVTTPLALTVTFTNAATTGWAPNAVSWIAQQQYPEFDADRYDPFLPVSMIWSTELDPLTRAAGSTYSAQNLTSFFQLDTDAIDYQYLMTGSVAVPFTTGLAVEYDNSVVLSKKPTFSLTKQIDSYVKNFPDDPANTSLQSISAYYQKRKIMAQSISGFSQQQVLSSFLAQIPVENLTQGPMDAVTKQISAAAVANPADNWYNSSFNGFAPTSTGLQALHNFGPLRSGFLEISSLEIVDVFGQRMQLQTATTNKDGSLQVTPAITMQPNPKDTAHAEMIYCPPRLLCPSRVWFRWLSAAHNLNVSGITADFVEMNTHPATSPICGWVLPNHLDDSLFFYDAKGQPIGSFSVEHGTVVYHTRAGNLKNPKGDLTVDVGPQGQPLASVNPHIADFMWYLNKNSAPFLRDLMQTILNSDTFINSANFAQDASLAVFIGRPLAITRAVLGMETPGGLLPLSQADTASTDPWPQDVNNGRYEYSARMGASSANLASVLFPARLGDLANIDDGLVGFLLDGAEPTPYGTFYSPAAKADGKNGVVLPTTQTLQLALNASPITITMLIDPRAAVHATVGVLPVEELSVPPDQYADTLRNLQMTFFTTPILRKSSGLQVPLPAEAGYKWSWVSPGATSELPQVPNAVNDDATWGYTAQTILEGWVKLSPELTRPPTKRPS